MYNNPLSKLSIYIIGFGIFLSANELYTIYGTLPAMLRQSIQIIHFPR